MSENSAWYALYTKPRWEKKVHELLQQQGVHSYCPVNKTRRKWSDRFKWVEEPIFKSYVFVRLEDEQMGSVRYVPGIVNFVYWLGRPAQIREEEIGRIKRFLNEYQDVHLEQLPEPKAGDRVKIASGLFMDNEGVVLSADKKRVEIRIESLGCKLVAKIEKENVLLK